MQPDNFDTYMENFESAMECNYRCREVLQSTRWPTGAQCPYCEHTKMYRIYESWNWECAYCRRQVTITGGTVFHGAQIELRKWFVTVYLMAIDGISGVRLAQKIGVDNDTALEMLRKLRVVMQKRNNEMLARSLVHGTHVLFKPRSKPVIKAVVSIRDENGVPKINLQCQDNVSLAKSKVLLPEKMENPEQYSKFVASVIGHFQRASIGTYHRYSDRYAQLYADEFSYRFNAEHPAQMLFSLMQDVCKFGPKS